VSLARESDLVVAKSDFSAPIIVIKQHKDPQDPLATTTKLLPKRPEPWVIDLVGLCRWLSFVMVFASIVCR